MKLYIATEPEKAKHVGQLTSVRSIQFLSFFEASSHVLCSLTGKKVSKKRIGEAAKIVHC